LDDTRIQTGATERVEVLVLDAALDPLTGKTDILLSIRRVSDGQWFDFADLTFKAAGWTTRQQQMTETDVTNDPGVYHYDFVTSTIANPTADDTYEMRADQSPGTDAANLPQTGELKVGQFVDDIDQAISTMEVNIRGGAGDTLETLSNQLDLVALEANVEGHVTDGLTAQGYTSVRALLLDNLDAAVSAILTAIAALNDVSIADVETAMGNQGYTTARAAYLDDLVTILAAVEKVRKVTSNRVVVNAADTLVTIYEDDGSTPAFTFTISGDRRERTP
jgi:hypothetical protein